MPHQLKVLGAANQGRPRGGLGLYVLGNFNEFPAPRNPILPVPVEISAHVFHALGMTNSRRLRQAGKLVESKMHSWVIVAPAAPSFHRIKRSQRLWQVNILVPLVELCTICFGDNRAYYQLSSHYHTPV